MKKIILLLSFVCFVSFGQKVIIVDTNNGNEYIKDFPSRTDSIPGLLPNLKVYLIHKKQIPSYDYLTEKIELSRRFTDSIADGNKYPYCVYEYKVTRLADTIIQQNKELAILQREMEILINNIPEDEFKQYVIMGLAALIYQSRGGTLNANHNEILDIIFNRGLKVYQNRANKLQLMQDLLVNPNIDINQNWNE